MTLKLSTGELSKMTLKNRFLYAVSTGELGTVDDDGIIVTVKQFKTYFHDIKSLYIHSFLPAATIEIGQNSITRTKFVFRMRKGLYRVHSDALKDFMINNEEDVKNEQTELVM